jgi:hypothetical protein
VLFAVAELVIGWRLIVGAQVALGKLGAANGADLAFYQGKVAAARFFAREILPNLALTRRLIDKGDLRLMELPDDAF